MIVKLVIQNWRSFKHETEFSMVASKERQHSIRVPKVKKYQARILPIAVFYGGNASGKTNLFKALSFIKTLVVKGTQPDSLIPIETFRLDSKFNKQPIKIKLEILVDGTIYEFSFAATNKRIIEEKLIEISSTRERLLYSREADNITFDPSLANDKFLQFVFQGTRDNQLFLTNSISQKVLNFLPVFNWFKNNLTLVAPDSRFEPFELFFEEKHPLFATMVKMLPLLDTGINHLGGDSIPFERLSIPPMLRSKIQEDLKEGMSARLEDDSNRYIITRKKNGELIAKKLVTFHAKEGGTEEKFEMDLESDGSQRVIDLLPAFLDVSDKGSNKVYIIDEVDRSLHTLLTRKLIEVFLSTCSDNSRSQLLLTTHDLLLMDQNIFRRDEMWITERDKSGASKLIPLSDYKGVRYDKDIRKSYLQGRFGGIPRILAERLVEN